jgi:DNA-binding NtrC family response regulator
VKLLNYPPRVGGKTDSEFEHRVDQLVLLAKALTDEIETLQAELATCHTPRLPKQIDVDEDGLDFYQEIEEYEVELIRSALHQCDGNQTQAAKLLRMKSTTLNAKMKHYGLSPVRSIMVQRQNGPYRKTVV